MGRKRNCTKEGKLTRHNPSGLRSYQKKNWFLMNHLWVGANSQHFQLKYLSKCIFELRNPNWSDQISIWSRLHNQFQTSFILADNYITLESGITHHNRPRIEEIGILKVQHETKWTLQTNSKWINLISRG